MHAPGRLRLDGLVSHGAGTVIATVSPRYSPGGPAQYAVTWGGGDSPSEVRHLVGTALAGHEGAELGHLLRFLGIVRHVPLGEAWDGEVAPCTTVHDFARDECGTTTQGLAEAWGIDAESVSATLASTSP